MSEGRCRLEWSQTAEVLCVLYNAYRDLKEYPKPFKSSFFNPYAKGGGGKGYGKKGIPLTTKKSFGMLESVFVKSGKR